MLSITRNFCFRGLLFSALSVVPFLVFPTITQAQLVPDNTLGTENSVVTPQNLRTLIEGGAIRGDRLDALFHSFTEFNVNLGEQVYFANPDGIVNIFTRVTGLNPSNINGVLGVDGGANLFLLNPNGISFGENASLDISGSFFATTADSFVFGNGAEFSGTNPQQAPLLTINITPGVQWGANPLGEITSFADLGVNSGESLTLHGTEVTNTGNLTASGGRVNLLGERINVLGNAQIDVSSDSGGGIVRIGEDFQGQGNLPTAQQVYIDAGVNINADGIRAGDGGLVIIWSEELTEFLGNVSARGGIFSGNGGFVEVSGKEQLIFRGNVDTSAINGNFGTLLLDPENLTIANGSGDSGFSGEVNANEVAPATIYESELEGLAGDTNVILQATNDITVEDLVDNELTFAPGSGGIAFSADADGDGFGSFVMEDFADTIVTNGRNIFIAGASLTLGSIDTSPSLGGELIAIVDVDSGGAIPETGTSGIAIFTFTAPDIGETISNLDVRFSATHTFNSDLDVSLQSPAGRVFELFSDVGSSGDNFQDTLLDDSAETSIADGSAPFDGTFRPEGEDGLARFNGENIAGVWTLTVTDNFTLDSGRLFRSGDTAPWGTAIGTQLLFNSLTTVTGGNGGSVELNATGDISIGTINTTGINANGGEVIINAGGDISTLDINSSANFALGGDINLIAGGNINTTGGTIITGTSSGNAANVSIQATGDLNLGNIQANGLISGDIFLGSQATILVGGNNIESIIEEGITGNAGNIDIRTSSLYITTGGRLDTSAYGQGNAGNVTIEAQDTVLIDSFENSSFNSSGIFSNVNGQLEFDELGDAGDITISTGFLQLTNGSSLNSRADLRSDNARGGNAGNITINARDNILIDGRSSGIFSSTSGSGEFAGAAGSIQITTGSFSLTNNASLLASSGTGETGDISISAISDVVLNSGGQIQATNRGSGTGSNINIAANSVLLDEATLVTNSIGTVGEDAGDIVIESQGEISFLSSTLRTEAQSLGDAGDIIINAEGGIIFARSNAPEVETLTTISTEVDSQAQGKGGNIEIEAESILVTDNTFISSDTEGQGDAGNIILRARDFISFTEESGLFANSLGQANAGNIILEAEGNVSFSSESSAGTNAFELMSGNAGDINIKANSLLIIDNSTLATTTEGIGFSGDVIIEVKDYFLVNNAGLLTNTTGTGNAGNITIEAGETVSFTNRGFANSSVNFNQDTGQVGAGNGGDITVIAKSVMVTDTSGLLTNTFGEGDAGNVTIIATENFSVDQSIILSTVGFGGIDFSIFSLTPEEQDSIDMALALEATLEGNAGNIDIKTPLLSVTNGSQIATATSAQGSAGNLFIREADIVYINNSSISAAVTERAFAEQTSNIDIQTGLLSLTDGAEITASTSGNGDAGNIVVRDSQTVTLKNSSISTRARGDGGIAGGITINTAELTLSEASDISASTNSTQGGSINLLNLENLEVFDSQISTSTETGTAGDLNINATESITIIGNSQSEQTQGLLAEATAGGTAGTLSINTVELNLESTSITVSSPQGEAGNLEINANNLSLNQSQITALTGLSTQVGGANITLEIADLLRIENESLISATALEDANGGNITINENIGGGFLVAFPSTGENGSDISANANRGDGGRVNITADGIFGIQFRDTPTPDNDITVTSTAGSDGTVQLNTPDTNPAAGLNNLPSAPANPQPIQGCQTITDEGDATFVDKGRGGLPPNPYEALSNGDIWEDVETPTQLTENPRQIIEAQGWIINEKGNVELVADVAAARARMGCGAS